MNLIVDKTNQQKCLGINEERRKSQLRMIARWSMGKSESWKKKKKCHKRIFLIKGLLGNDVLVICYLSGV